LISVSKGSLGTLLAHLLHESGSIMFEQKFVLKHCEARQSKKSKTTLLLPHDNSMAE
jgi:hypothetical protein